MITNRVVLRIFYTIRELYFCEMNNNLYIKDSKIDISDEGISYWAKQLGCSEKDLRDAISKIGNTYNVLIPYMEMNQLINRD